MPLAAGTPLGPYEILSLIGAGPLGEVYEARDVRLRRTVAVKVTKEALSDEFRREAVTISSLSHPHICGLYDVGENYLGMEYVEGKAMLGPVPWDEALRFGDDLLDVLETAHSKGILHRNLKPSNILVTKGGIKVTGFGLAKVERAREPKKESAKSAGPSERVIVGAPQYMAPEQIEGRPVDARTDIFAFGVVMYELISGRPAFQGKNQTELVEAVLHKQPRPLHQLLPDIPLGLERVIKKCLEKDPEQRWQTIREVSHALQWMSLKPSEAKSTWKELAVEFVVVAMALITAAAGWGWWHGRQPALEAPKALVRLDVDLGSDVALPSASVAAGPSAILSPDGTRLIYVSRNRLFTRRLDQSDAVAIEGSDGASSPFFSPEGDWVAFFASGKLKKVPVKGGAAVALCDAPAGGSGSWGSDGNIVASLGINGGLRRIPSSGGAPEPITEVDPDRGEVAHLWPQILSGRQAVLFTVKTAGGTSDSGNIEVIALGDHHRKTVHHGGTFGRYLPTGHLLYMNQGTLFATPFDLTSLEAHGVSVPLLDEVGYSPVNGSAQFDFSRDGTLVYRRGTTSAGERRATLRWLDAKGKMQPLLSDAGAYLHPRISPDGQRLALEIRQGSTPDIWVYEWQRDKMTRLTFGGAYNGSPIWTPDGRNVVFSAEGKGLMWTPADGSRKPEPLIESERIQLPQSFTAEGKRLAFFQLNPGSVADIWTVAIDTEGTELHAEKPELFLQTQLKLRDAALSPDGRWLAYTSVESGPNQVYVRPFPGAASGARKKWQISISGGTFPIFARNEQELFFETLDNRIMAASYSVKGDVFVAGKPRLWSDKRLGGPPAGSFWNYDVAPDGQRIVALMPAEAPDEYRTQNHITFLENFFDEVRRRTPGK